VDIFTAARTLAPHDRRPSENVRAVHLRAGLSTGSTGTAWALPERVHREFRRFVSAQRCSYDILHGHYWLSGIVAAHLSKEMNIPMVQNFHSIGLLKNIALRKTSGKEGYDPVLRLEREKG